MSQGLGRVEGKNALVTGAGSGIGLAIAKKFAREGAHVTLVDLHEDRVEESRAALVETGASADGLVCDVSNHQETVEKFRAADRKHPYSILVNNAGIAHIGNV